MRHKKWRWISITQAVAYYGSVLLKMFYDNLKTVVDTIFVGKVKSVSLIADLWP